MKPRTAMLKDKKKCPILNIEENFYFWEKDVKAALLLYRNELHKKYLEQKHLSMGDFVRISHRTHPDLFKEERESEAKKW